jgi:hypothetical protein
VVRIGGYEFLQVSTLRGPHVLDTLFNHVAPPRRFVAIIEIAASERVVKRQIASKVQEAILAYTTKDGNWVLVIEGYTALAS